MYSTADIPSSKIGPAIPSSRVKFPGWKFTSSKENKSIMKYVTRDLAIVTGILIALAGTAVPARAGFTSITKCDPTTAAPTGSLISASGDYQVSADIASASGDCILITVRGVSLKLNGHTISGPVGPGVGINVNPPAGRVDHVTVQGPGVIKGF